MLLTAVAIAEKIELGIAGDANGVGVVPTPDLAAIRAGGGASVDLRLGRWFLAIRQSKLPLIDPDHEYSAAGATSGEERMKARERVRGSQRTYFIPFDGKFYLHPGRFVLGITLEWLRLPSRIAGHVTGKSSWGRRGLIIETAAGIHPGFSGYLALELANVGELPIILRPGMPICQVFLSETTPGIVTSSAFDGRRRPVLGTISEDPVFSRLSAKRQQRETRES